MQPVIESQPESAFVAFGLARLYDALRRLAPRMGLSLTAHSTLKRLDQLGPQRLSELHAAESVTQPAMTQLVTRLEKDGFAVRGGDPADRRAVLVSITEAGSALVEQRRVAYAEALDTVLASLSAPDRAAIIAALPAMERLVDAVAAHTTT
ncbi:MarR family transcriptional regulator [Winogradskya consettensis]|uniref:MarR family transcriptional regulator n=1 Tax=Winogradskya consettensis TaxID=113560 RepID=A0A919SUN2_9ACTN|nr:MarR family transcriptional regulator [Actinoplanes consettensis]GIM77811.1 MarR family transcriptional regulator [Actinoplanes consettensis]